MANHKSKTIGKNVAISISNSMLKLPKPVVEREFANKTEAFSAMSIKNTSFNIFCVGSKKRIEITNKEYISGIGGATILKIKI